MSLRTGRPSTVTRIWLMWVPSSSTCEGRATQPPRTRRPATPMRPAVGGARPADTTGAGAGGPGFGLGVGTGGPGWVGSGSGSDGSVSPPGQRRIVAIEASSLTVVSAASPVADAMLVTIDGVQSAVGAVVLCEHCRSRYRRGRGSGASRRRRRHRPCRRARVASSQARSLTFTVASRERHVARIGDVERVVQRVAGCRQDRAGLLDRDRG